MTMIMRRRSIRLLHRKAFIHVRQRDFACLSSSSDDRNLSSYRERLRNGISDIKKDDAVNLFDSMIQSRPLPTIVDFSRLFSAVAKTKQYDLVLSLCKQLEELQGNNLHNNYTLNIMINCFCRLRKLGFAFSVLGRILKLGYEPNTSTYSTLVNGLCLQGRVSEAVLLVDRMVTPNLITLNTLVNGLCLNGKVSEAVALIDRMVENGGCQPNACTYGPVLNSICKSAGNADLTLDLLKHVEAKVKLGVVQYNMVVDSLCKEEGRLEDALSLFNEMEAKGGGIKANVITYSTLIGSFCRAGRWDEGARLLRDMITRNITPSVVTFSALIDSLVKEGKLKEAKELYNEMIARGIEPDAFTYNSLMYGLCMENRLDEADQMLDLMVSKGCDPDIVTYSILINGYCKAKHVDEGMKIFRELSLRGLVANTVTYSTLIQGFCEAGKLNVAKQLFQEMVSRGVSPSVATYGILLDGLCENGEVEEALGIFHKRLCKKGSLSEADMLFKKMGEEDGVAPNECTYNTIIRAHLGGSGVATSVELIEEMKRCGFSADASTMKMVIDMLSDGRLNKSFLSMLS